MRVDIRIIATSNRNLADEVKKGTFREDLLYRLNVVHLRLPALRERPSDILALAEYFTRKYAEVERPSAASAVGGRPQALMTKNPWRGNVRELENTLHRAVLLATGSEIGPDAIMTPEGESIGAISSDPALRAAQRPRP